MGIDPTQPGSSSQDQPSPVARKEKQGHLGSHNVSEIPKKGPLFAVANVIAKVAKVVFTAAFVIPIAVTLLASKKTYSFGSIGGKGDKLATKVRNFFVGFFHEKISGKLFGDVKFAKAELALKTDYYAFIKKNNFAHYKSQLSTLLNDTLNLTFSEENSKSTQKEEFIKSVLALPPTVREKLLEDEEMFKKLSNGQLDNDELKKLKDSSHYSSSLSTKINEKLKGSERVFLNLLIDFPKNMGLAFYFAADPEKSKKYKGQALSELAKLDPQTNSYLIKGLSKCADEFKKSIFYSDHNIFSEEELTYIQDGFKWAGDISDLINNSQRSLTEDEIKALKEICENLLLCFMHRSENVIEAKFKQNLLDQLIKFEDKEKTSFVQSVNIVVKALEKLQILYPREKLQFESLLNPSASLSKKPKKVEFENKIEIREYEIEGELPITIQPKQDFLDRFKKEKEKIASLVDEAYEPIESLRKKELIRELQEKITLFQELCDGDLSRDNIEKLLKRSNEKTPFSKEERMKIIQFALRPNRHFESRYISDLKQIREILRQQESGTSSTELIPQLKAYMLGLQRSCKSKLEKEEIKELLKNSNGEPVFNDQEIQEIIEFLR